MLVNLPYHTFPGKAQSAKGLTSTCAHSFAKTDNYPSRISIWERMTLEDISWLISMKECSDLVRIEPTTSWSPVGSTSNWTTEADKGQDQYVHLHCLIRPSLSTCPASILLKSISACYQPNRTPVRLKTVRYRFKQNACFIQNHWILQNLLMCKPLWSCVVLLASMDLYCLFMPKKHLFSRQLFLWFWVFIRQKIYIDFFHSLSGSFQLLG